jgi:hypothetical protein
MEEMPFPTSPESHFFFTLELSHRGVHIQSFAPRFVGKFQRGISDRGEREDFYRQFYQHVLIAQNDGHYKISIHSESDQFSFLSDMGELSQGHLHLKTSETGWLEAMRLIALRNPSLHRKIHHYALSKFKEASNLDPVTTHLIRIPNPQERKDQELSNPLDQEDTRQLLHYILHAKEEDGKNLFRNPLYRTLTQYEEEYWSLIEKQLEKHLNALGAKKRKN